MYMNNNTGIASMTTNTVHCVSKKYIYPLMFDNNFGKCGPIFKIISPIDSYENSLYNTQISNSQYYVATHYTPTAILNFKNVRIWSSDCHRLLNLHLFTKFHQNRIIFSLRYGGLTIFKMTDLRRLEC